MSKFACFVQNAERNFNEHMKKEETSTKKKPKVQMCCEVTDLNGYTFTHALVDKFGNITCTECGRNLITEE